jgi:hypothetical protein
MASPMHERFKRHTRTHIERANALGSIHLVASNGEKIDPQIVDQRGDFPYGLGGVCVHQDAMLTRHMANLSNGLQRTDFVIGMHNAN